jgi:hypothetical protein
VEILAGKTTVAENSSLHFGGPPTWVLGEV